MQSTRRCLSLIICASLLGGCDASGLLDDQPDDSLIVVTPAAPATVAQPTPVQVQGAPVIIQDGQYLVSAERKVEPLPQQINTGSSLPYPQRTGFEIKSLHTDFWPNRQQLLDAGTAGISVNLVWENWQPALETNCTPSQITFEGQCFTIETAFDNQIRYWSGLGKTVTGVLYGVPSWARDNSICTATSDALAKFCAARNPADYARFVAMIAERYNGLNGAGRIADFVIHNEVNMNQWYKVGCGGGIPCDQEKWIADYAANFNAAYDRITAVQPAAKVFVPFAHQFDTVFDHPEGANPIISVKSFIRGVHSRAEGRKWRIAYHPYHTQLRSAESSFNDFPRVTFGNIGVLSGWLRQEFPFQPESWQVHLTENGVSSNGLSDEYSQDIAVCNSYRNVLGTPGIENYIYHRMQDHSAEANQGAAFGLHRTDGSPKPVWDTWSTMSDRTGQQDNLDCGFENLPYTKLTSYADSLGNYRASTRVTGNNFGAINQWYLLRDYQPDTYMAYECKFEDSSYISTDMFCDGKFSFGPVGYVHEFDAADRVPLFTCANDNRVYSSDEFGCGGDRVIEFIGYVRKNK